LILKGWGKIAAANREKLNRHRYQRFARFVIRQDKQKAPAFFFPREGTALFPGADIWGKIETGDGEQAFVKTTRQERCLDVEWVIESCFSWDNFAAIKILPQQ